VKNKFTNESYHKPFEIWGIQSAQEPRQLRTCTLQADGQAEWA